MKFHLLLVCFLVTACAEYEVAPKVDLRDALELPYFRNPLDPHLSKSWRHLDLIFEKVDFQGRFKERIPALICYSEIGRTSPLPAIICMPGSSNRKEDLLQPLDLMPQWAERGFFVVSIDRPYAGNRPGSLQEAVREKGLPRIWGEYVYDLMCAVDYLQTRSEVDAQRIGMLGLSMGGWEALLLAAVDRRIQVLVCVAGQLTWAEVFRDRTWQAIFQGVDLRHKLVKRQASGAEAWQAFRSAYPALVQVDAPLMTERIAPRALLLMTGQDDTYITPAAASKTYETASREYRRQGRQDRLDMWIVPGVGHSFPKAMQQRALAWFRRWL